ncbi:pyridoxamine 5'-phosphate oxidase family protein [Candidatus Roizmanbacteria bacterium]|nr:pyridoxamine 5'-phosphate oxidase family protein [Candidatus Roizmanbacteria bacterium]
MNDKHTILEFISHEKLAVIATVGTDSKPESAVLEFGQTDSLELIFDCFSSSRKYNNLQTNKNVAFVIGWDNNITVQYEGIATELTGSNATLYKETYWKKNPEAKRWDSREGITYFKVSPRWIRYSDLNADPWKVIEVTDFS